MRGKCICYEINVSSQPGDCNLTLLGFLKLQIVCNGHITEGVFSMWRIRARRSFALYLPPEASLPKQHSGSGSDTVPRRSALRLALGSRTCRTSEGAQQQAGRKGTNDHTYRLLEPRTHLTPKEPRPVLLARSFHIDIPLFVGRGSHSDKYVTRARHCLMAGNSADCEEDLSPRSHACKSI